MRVCLSNRFFFHHNFPTQRNVPTNPNAFLSYVAQKSKLNKHKFADDIYEYLRFHSLLRVWLCVAKCSKICVAGFFCECFVVVVVVKNKKITYVFTNRDFGCDDDGLLWGFGGYLLVLKVAARRVSKYYDKVSRRR